MRIAGRGTIYNAMAKGTPREARFCIFPSLARLQGGELACSFRTGSAKDSADEDCRVLVSADHGASWQTALAGFGDLAGAPPGRWRVRCLAVAALGGDRLAGSLCCIDRSDPALPMFNPQIEGILPTRVLYARSVDGGWSWPDPCELSLAPHSGNATTGSILVLGNGDLALPYEAWKDYYDVGPGRHHAALRISRDGDMTWPVMSIVAHDPDGRVLYWDQRLSVEPESGRLIAMFWTHDRQAGRDLPIHVATGSPDGLTWSMPQSTSIAGQICAPLALGGGRVFAAYVHRHNPPGLRAVLSDDFGQSWTAAEELVFYEKALGGGESGMTGQRDFADYWADMSIWTFGHPAPLALPGGDVMVAYYAGDASAMSIEWVRIEI